MPRVSLKHLVALALFVSASLAQPALAAAVAPPVSVSVAVDRTSGAPSTYFSRTVRPGTERAAGDLVLRNTSSQPVAVRLRPVNALTTDTLGAAYGAAGTRPQGAATWVRLGDATLRLAPGERRRVPVGVRVPADAAVGDYLAGISISTPGLARTSTPQGGLMISEEYRYAVGVQTRVPGPRTPRLELPSAKLVRQPASPVVLIRARSTGNATLQGVHGSVLVTSGDRVVARQSIGPGTFVAGTAIWSPVRLNGERPDTGEAYRVRARMVYGRRVATLDTLVRFPASAAKVQEQYAPPAEQPRASSEVALWSLAAGAALVALALLFWGWRRRHVPGPRMTGRALDRELARLDANGRPLSVVRVAPVSGGRERRAVARALRPLLPSSNRIGRLDAESLMVLLPRTSAPLVAALEEEIRDALAALNSRRGVTSATVGRAMARDVLLARLEPRDVPDADELPAHDTAA